jgi:amino acid transporter
MNETLTSPFPNSINECEAVQKRKLGTFMGAYLPSVVMLFGVVIFLRLGWIMGNVGLYTTLLIITLACSIILITILSLSSAATNIQVGKGGTYFMISRALGLELGSAIGLSLFLKQSICVAFAVIGFSESFHGLFPQFSFQTIGLSTLAILTIVNFISTKFVLKIQVFLFGIIAVSLFSFFSGQEITSTYSSAEPINTSMSFWMAFAIFFPAMTGLESSLSLSGDLKNPSRSLPEGVISAVITAYVFFMLMACFLWANAPQQVLIEDKLIIQHISKYESLIILGIWGATLSTALGAMLGAPKTLQALAEDKVVPSFLGRGVGSSKEPRFATSITVLIALVSILFGSINAIAPILTMICLSAYAILNLSTGLEDLMDNPSWRPTFPSHWLVSFFGAALCVIAMLMINAGAALIVVFGIAGFYCFFIYKKIDASWEDTRYGILMFFARFALYRLACQEPSSRSWRPNCLVFTDKPFEISNSLLNFTAAITQTKGFLTMASILPKAIGFKKNKQALQKKIKTLFAQYGIEAFISISEADRISMGMKRIITHHGLGPLTPNTCVWGGISQEEDLPDYLEVIKFAYDQGRNVVIINDKLQKGIKGDIHVWWDENNPHNTEIMLVMAYMLSKQSRKSQVYLVGISSNEESKNKKIEEFNEIILRNRLKIEPRVLIPSSQATDELDLVKKFSAGAAIVFLSLRPFEPHETLVEYADYFKKLPHKDSSFPMVALVLGAKQTDLHEIVQINI